MVRREGVHPGLVAFFLGDTCGIVIVLEVVLAQVVFRGEGTAARPAALGGVVVRRGEGVLDGVAVDHPQLHQLAAGPVAAARLGGDGIDLLVGEDRLVEEHEVVRVEVLAVGPLHAVAQVEREHQPVVGHLPGAGDVGIEDVGRRIPLGHRLLPFLDELPGVTLAADVVEDAAVLPDLERRPDDLRVAADALFHRRQLSLGHQGGQHGRLVEGVERLAGGGGVGRGAGVDVVDVRLLVDLGEGHVGAARVARGSAPFLGTAGQQRHGRHQQGNDDQRDYGNGTWHRGPSLDP